MEGIDKVLFSGCDGESSGVFVSDGTAAGTFLLAGMEAPGEALCTTYYSSAITVVGDIAFFYVDGKLWRTDGTPAGTVPLIADPASPGPKKAFGLTVWKDAVWFFTGTGDPSDGLGEPFALWRSDGTAAGTRLVKNLSPSRGEYGILPPLLTPVGDTLFFRADDGVHGRELWLETSPD